MKPLCSFETSGTTCPMMQHHIAKTRILKFNEEFQGQYENTHNAVKTMGTKGCHT